MGVNEMKDWVFLIFMGLDSKSDGWTEFETVGIWRMGVGD
jgi:hypothetical protein